MSSRSQSPSNLTIRYITYMHPVSNYMYKLPMVYVKLINKHEIFETPALINSGATFSFLQKSLRKF